MPARSSALEPILFIKEPYSLCPVYSSRACRHILDCSHYLRQRLLQWTRPTSRSLLGGILTDLTRTKPELLAENALLRQQVIILRRQVKRPACTKTDHVLLVLLARAVRHWKQALFIVQPDTLLTWHRQAFRWYWRQRSKPASTKPRVAAETVELIKAMALNNRLWGAERIRRVLLKLGIHVSKRTIQKYMRQGRIHPTSQTWSTFCITTHTKSGPATSYPSPTSSSAPCLPS